MSLTKLDMRMINEGIEFYFGDMQSNDACPFWLESGRIVFVTYGRLRELLGGGGVTPPPPPGELHDGGLVGVDPETTFVDGGLVGVDVETGVLDGGLVGE